jgi:hypothetical protein
MSRGILVLLLVFLLSSVPMFAFAEGTAVVTVGSSGSVEPGAEFTVSVSIADNPGFSAAAFTLSYDKNALELVDFGSDGLLKGGQITNVADDSIGYFSMGDIQDNGVLFIATFRVKDTAEEGSYALQVGLRDGHDSNFANFNAEVVPISFVAGSVQVGGDLVLPPDPGDANGGGGSTSDPTGGGSDPSGGSVTQGSSGGTLITAVGQDGSEVQFLLRSTDGVREYSLDEGATWNKVPDDGIITTLDGKKISIDGTGDADFTVKDLPASLAVNTADQGGLSPVVVAVIIVAIIAIIALVIIMVRKQQKKPQKQKKHSPESEEKTEKPRHLKKG